MESHRQYRPCPRHRFCRRPGGRPGPRLRRAEVRQQDRDRRDGERPDGRQAPRVARRRRHERRDQGPRRPQVGASTVYERPPGSLLNARQGAPPHERHPLSGEPLRAPIRIHGDAPRGAGTSGLARVHLDHRRHDRRPDLRDVRKPDRRPAHRRKESAQRRAASSRRAPQRSRRDRPGRPVAGRLHVRRVPAQHAGPRPRPRRRRIPAPLPVHQAVHLDRQPPARRGARNSSRGSMDRRRRRPSPGGSAAVAGGRAVGRKLRHHLSCPGHGVLYGPAACTPSRPASG